MTAKKPKKHDVLQVTVDSLLFGGEGVGAVDGFKIFVPRSAPQDDWEVQVTRVHSKYAEARGLRLLKPSPLRIEPRCPYFERCGGCSYQFLSVEEQLRQKERQVRDALDRIGQIHVDDFRSIVPSPKAWRYRNKMEFSFATGTQGELELGLHPTGYHYEVTNMRECFLVSERVESLLNDVREWAREGGYDVWHPKKGTGSLRSVILREGFRTGELMMILQVHGASFAGVDAWKKRFECDSRVTSLYVEHVMQMAGRRTQIQDLHLAGRVTLHERLELSHDTALDFEILPQAFFQTNSFGAEQLYRVAVDFAALQGGERVLDLYSGTGTIGLFMAQKAGEVLGVDLNESAILNAQENAQRNHIENVRFIAGDSAAVLRQASFAADVLVVDPPRAGLSTAAIEEVLRIRAPRMVYVSCNPSTLARDLQILTMNGYTVRAVQPVEMFPQTSHVETVVQIELN